MNKYKFLISAALVLASACLTAFILTVFFPARTASPETVTVGGMGQTWPSSYRNAAVNTVVQLNGTTSTLVLDANVSRLWAYGNNTGPSTTWCSKQATSTGVTAGTGFPLYSQGSFEFNQGDPYQGQLWCITTSGTSSIALAYVIF